MKRSRRTKTKRGFLHSYQGLVIITLGAVFILTSAWFGWRELYSSDPPPSVQASSSERAEATSGVLEGQVAPDFSVPTLEGDTFQLSDQRGRPTIIFIMAYWCGTCIPEARALAHLKQEYGEGLSILSLDVDPSSTPEALAQFKSAVGDPDYVWGFDTNQNVAKAYKVFSLDTTIIIDAAGRVVYRDNAPTPYRQLNKVIAPLVEAQGT